MYDVIVVGARCAGAPAAMLLARLGYRVLLVDQASFQRHPVYSFHQAARCGHAPAVAASGPGRRPRLPAAARR
jgi:flavin-dependent dehydrogenase